MTAPGLIVEGTIRFLRGHEPFARMTRASLELVAGRSQLTYHPAGSAITGPDAVDGAFYIVHQGHVAAREAGESAAIALLAPGECFPLATGPGAPPAATYMAAEDSFCYRLAAEDLAALRAVSPPFDEFCAQSRESLLRESLGRARGEFGSRIVEQHALLQPVAQFVRRAPVTCGPDMPLRDALQAMASAAVGTIAIVDGHGVPIGIFTLTDLMERVVVRDVPLSTPIAQVMSTSPGVIAASASADEALAVMAETGYHQLLLVSDGRLVGVVSERDLFALQRVSMRHVLVAIRRAGDVRALRRAALDTASLGDNLVAQGLSAEALTRTIAALRDAITARALALVEPAHALEGIRWCWLALGSEGRAEQTIVSDQDNALLFDHGPCPLVEARHRLLAFAAAVNDALVEVGFPPCPGEVMARNPQYCLSRDEWRDQFAAWLREPTPEALLGASILFDFRALGGDPALADELRQWLGAVAPDSGLFLRLLTTNAVSIPPPLGVVRTFLTPDGPGRDRIDLKIRGTRLFVDAARVLALATGARDTGTAARVRAAGQRLGLPERDRVAYVEAFQYLQLLRLRAQRGAIEAAGGEAVNAVDPEALSALDRRMLHEALRQARSLQALCARSYAP